MSAPVKIALKYPIKVNGEETSELTMRRPVLRDMRVASKSGSNDPDRELHLLASLTGVSPGDLESLDMADYLQMQEAYAGFLS